MCFGTCAALDQMVIYQLKMPCTHHFFSSACSFSRFYVGVCAWTRLTRGSQSFDRSITSMCAYGVTRARVRVCF